MRIQNINPYNYQTCRQSFRSCARQYISDRSDYWANDVLTTTCLFRSDINWQTLMDIVQRNFANKQQVNTYSLASSDGSEAYTFAMMVLDRIPKEQQSKYFPIIASDIDDEVIRVANSGLINLTFQDLVTAEEILSKPKNYFEYVGDAMPIENNKAFQQKYFDDYCTYRPIPELAETIKFEKSDMLDKLKNLDDKGNSIIFCRNVMMYLKPDYLSELIQTIYKKLKSGSLLVIGRFDTHTGIQGALSDGFETCAQHIYRRI